MLAKSYQTTQTHNRQLPQVQVQELSCILLY